MRKRDYDRQAYQRPQHEDDEKMMEAQRDFAFDHQYAHL
jgi:hypothetical protein